MRLYLYFTKIFVHLSVIAAVCYFSVYKLIGWDPANIYVFKVNSRTLEKGVIYFFLTVIGLPHGQLWAILKETASLTRF